MASSRGVEHIGLEHGIEGHTPDLDAVGYVATNGAVGQNVHVVLGVLPDLELGRVFQQRLEGAQYSIAVQLLGHAHVGVRERNIGGFEGLHGKGQPDKLRLLGVKASGFGVKSDQGGLVQLP
ncbi:hypothetical protein D3C76_1211520 [compost metagenome]